MSAEKLRAYINGLDLTTKAGQKALADAIKK